MAKKPKGFAPFDSLMRKLVKVPPAEVNEPPKRWCPVCPRPVEMKRVPMKGYECPRCGRTEP